MVTSHIPGGNETTEKNVLVRGLLPVQYIYIAVVKGDHGSFHTQAAHR